MTVLRLCNLGYSLPIFLCYDYLENTRDVLSHLHPHRGKKKADYTACFFLNCGLFDFGLDLPFDPKEIFPLFVFLSPLPILSFLEMNCKCTLFYPQFIIDNIFLSDRTIYTLIHDLDKG